MSDNVDLGINRIVRAGSKWRLNASRKWWSVALAAAAVIGLLTVCGFRFIQLDGVGESLSTSNPSLQSLIDAQTTIDDGTPIVDWILSWKRSEVEETLHGAAGAFVLRIKVQTEESLVNSKDEPGFLLQHSLTLADKRKESLGTAVRQLDRLKQGSELRLIYENALVREKEQSDTWTQHYTPFDEAFLELPEASLVGRNARLEQFRKTWNQASYAKRADKFRELEEMRVITDAYFLEALRRKIDALMPCPELHDWECQATLAQHEVSAINGANAELSEACSEWSRLEDQRAAAQLRSKRFDGYRIVVRTTREFLDGGSLRALDHHLKTCQELNSSDLDYLSREVQVAVEERTAAVYKAAMDAIAALLLPENVETQFDLKTLSEVVSARNGVIAKAREVLPEPSKEASGLESIANTDTDRLRSASAHVARYGPFDRAFAELDHSEPAGKNARIVQFREKWPEVDFPDRSGVFGKLEVMRVFVNEYHLDRLKRAVDGLTPCPDPHDWACQATLAQHEVTAIVVATKELSDDSSERSKLENQHTDAQARAEKCEGYRMVSRTTRELLAGDSLRALDTYLKTCQELNSSDLDYLSREVQVAVEERTAAVYKAAMDAIAALLLPENVETQFDLKTLSEVVSARNGVIAKAREVLPEPSKEASGLESIANTDTDRLRSASAHVARYGPFDRAFAELDHSEPAGKNARIVQFREKWPEVDFPDRSGVFGKLEVMRVFVNEYHLDRLKRAVDGLTPCPDPHDWACQATLAQHEVTAIVVATKELSDDSSERSKLENQHTDAQARAEKCEGYRMVSRTTRELLAGDSLRALDTYLKTCPELNSSDLEYLYKEVRAAVEERTTAVYKKAMDAIATLPLPKKFESKSELAIFNEAVLSRKEVIEVALTDLPPNCDSARRLIDTISADSKPLVIKRQEIEFESAKREFDDEFKRSGGAEARVTLIKAFVGRFPPSAFPSRSTQIEAVQSMLPEQEQSAKIESLAARVGALEQSFPKGEPDKLSLHRTKCEDLLKELVPIDVVGYQALRTRLQEQLTAVKREIGDGSFRDCEECWQAFCATPGNLGLWERFKGRANVFLAGKSVPLDQKIQLTKQVTDGNGYIGRRTDFINAFKEFEKGWLGREASDLWNRVVNGAQAAEDADTYNPNFHTGIEYKFDREYIDCVRYVLRVNAGVHVSATLMWFDVSNTPLDETTQVELVAKLNCSGKTISTKSMYDLPSKGDVRGTAGDFEEQLDLKIVDELRGTLTELDWGFDPHEETNFSVAAYKVFMEAKPNGVSVQTITCTPHTARLEIAFRGLPIKPTFSNEVKK